MLPRIAIWVYARTSFKFLSEVSFISRAPAITIPSSKPDTRAHRNDHRTVGRAGRFRQRSRVKELKLLAVFSVLHILLDLRRGEVLGHLLILRLLDVSVAQQIVIFLLALRNRIQAALQCLDLLVDVLQLRGN